MVQIKSIKEDSQSSGRGKSSCRFKISNSQSDVASIGLYWRYFEQNPTSECPTNEIGKKCSRYN